MTIVVVAFRDDPSRAIAHKKFSGPNCTTDAWNFYGRLLEKARMETLKAKPRVISTRIIVDG